MLNYTNSSLTKISVHKVGNKFKEEGYTLSKKENHIENSHLKSLLVNYFLSPFKNVEYHNFYHESEIEHNNVYAFICKIFDSKSNFFEKSKSIAKHLYEHSTHPKIKSGELYITYFDNCIIDNEEAVDAIGIFKSETKDVFLKISETSEGNFDIQQEEGISINKIDKGCIIFNSNRENGFKVCTIDTINKSNDAQYWKDDFLRLKPSEDSYHITQNYLRVAKEFVTKQLSEEYEVTKANQIDYLNKSVNFFKENTHFDEKQFSKEVFGDTNVIRSFNKFKQNHSEELDIDIENGFEISSNAVVKQSKSLKKVLKLDKNFHVYIHGSSDLIENGRDKDGRKYYKLYYDKED